MPTWSWSSPVQDPAVAYHGQLDRLTVPGGSLDRADLRQALSAACRGLPVTLHHHGTSLEVRPSRLAAADELSCVVSLLAQAHRLTDDVADLHLRLRDGVLRHPDMDLITQVTHAVDQSADLTLSRSTPKGPRAVFLTVTHPVFGSSMLLVESREARPWFTIAAVRFVGEHPDVTSSRLVTLARRYRATANHFGSRWDEPTLVSLSAFDEQQLRWWAQTPVHATPHAVAEDVSPDDRPLVGQVVRGTGMIGTRDAFGLVLQQSRSAVLIRRLQARRAAGLAADACAVPVVPRSRQPKDDELMTARLVGPASGSGPDLAPLYLGEDGQFYEPWHASA